LSANDAGKTFATEIRFLAPMSQVHECEHDFATTSRAVYLLGALWPELLGERSRRRTFPVRSALSSNVVSRLRELTKHFQVPLADVLAGGQDQGVALPALRARPHSED
jgi:hypothetical protein